MSSTNSKLTRVADNIRILSAAMVEKAKSGHPGGAMGGADFVTVLYTEFLRYDPDNMAYPYRDRFFLDPGHMSPMLYSVLSLAGYYTTEDLQSLRQWGSVTPGHPEVDVMRGVENTSGPLGQGHAMALGAAIAERFMAGPFRRVDGAQDLCLHLRRRRRRGDLAGRGTHRRASGVEQLHHVLRFEQHPALDQGR